MAQRSNAHTTIQYSQEWGGDPLAPWRGVRDCFAFKTCPVCGGEFRPYRHNTGPHAGHLETEKSFLIRTCCGKSCAKKLKNPMHELANRQKVSETFKARGIQPVRKWGNGNGLTPIQEKMAGLLGDGWVPELAIATGKGRGNGYPTCYKVDLGHPVLMIALELDGSSHRSPKRREMDQRKDALLRALGWKVLRLWNTEAESLCSTFGSQVTPRILQMAS